MKIRYYVLTNRISFMKGVNIVDFKQMEYYLMIAKLKSMTKAAAELHVAQPYLSRQLKQLEDDLGVTLLKRTTREMQLTAAGRVLQQRAQELLELRQQSLQELTAVADGQLGTLKIGVTASINNGLVPAWLAQYYQQYPKVQFIIEEQSGSEMPAMLAQQRIDLGIIRATGPIAGFQMLKLPSVPIVMVGHQLATTAEDKGVPIIVLKGQPLLVHRYHANLIAKLCHAAGFEPNFLAQVDDPLTLLRLANQGLGTALIPQDWLDLVQSRQRQVQILAAPELTRPTAVIWQTEKLSLAARNFVELIQAQKIEIKPNVRLI